MANWFQPQEQHSAPEDSGPAPAEETAVVAPERGSRLVSLAAVLFVPAVIYSCLGSAVVWTGWTTGDELGIALVLSLLGLVFPEDPNAAAGVCAVVTIVVALVVATLAVLLPLRIALVRPALTALSWLVVAYQGYAVAVLLSEGVAEQGMIYVVLPVVALLLWLLPSVVVSLPGVGRALRRAA
ncbi:hypothetical protein B1813_13345 [Saccharomonospora piscinae]|uniref:Uncharacterized protein n=1 Tax=Saccharomonospora piscinae TaxID=687388 RepID=A0A1V9A0E4_SACPI|nr:hypothetical protein [Saccharomonospora piscinae]OQO90541.1 hypothetical protein B1813_13345 [Saccharomonospora piscinae]TLW93211.1 hypothetical protein FFT09_07275 [Saccharomonospora piscinae]